MEAKRYYLDADSKPFPEVLESSWSLQKKYWQNLHSPYHGIDYQNVIDESLKRIYGCLGASEEDDFIFTSAGIAEIYNAIYSDFIFETGRNHICIPKGENALFYHCANRLEKLGCAIHWLEENEKGQITADQIEEAINPRTSLLSLSFANPLTGVMHPIWDIADVCKKHGLFLHVDVSSVLGKIYFQFSDLPIDFLTFDGGRVHAPIGSGGLLIKKNVKMASIYGGSLNVGELYALGQALEMLMEKRERICLEIPRLRDQFEYHVLKEISGARVAYQESERLPHVSTIIFPEVHAESLLYALYEKRIYASIGGGQEQALSHVLNHQGAISFSFPLDFCEEDLAFVQSQITETVKRLQKISAGVFAGE